MAKAEPLKVELRLDFSTLVQQLRDLADLTASVADDLDRVSRGSQPQPGRDD